MTIPEIRNKISELYIKWTGNSADEIKELPLSGSNRKYFRVFDKQSTFIATYNADREENVAFFYLAQHLKDASVNVPEVFFKDVESGVYFQQDLGDENLFDYITDGGDRSEDAIFETYKKVIDQMPKLQYEASKEMDYSYCYPRKAFDKQSIQWDLNYFKYCFLKLVNISFNEQQLENDFQRLTDYVLKAPSNFFLFRDFQSRNIMLNNGEVYFIDFQGGREGGLQYDLASLLYESKTNLSNSLRNKILKYYVEVFSRYDFFDGAEFIKYYPYYALVRVLQAFGAYGYRGLFEKKAFFVNSIVAGADNLKSIIQYEGVSDKLPYLCQLIEEMQGLKQRFSTPEKANSLRVAITSFSYKKGYPDDWSGNGGGFVFDCRALPNPGRYEEYRTSTGRDENVKEFLSKESDVVDFISDVCKTIGNSVQKYSERGFTHLSVSFGCTGGQHRSVYSAEQIYSYLKMNFDVDLRLTHRELNLDEFYDQDKL